MRYKTFLKQDIKSSNKEKSNRFGYIKIKSFFSSKETLKSKKASYKLEKGIFNTYHEATISIQNMFFNFFKSIKKQKSNKKCTNRNFTKEKTQLDI